MKRIFAMVAIGIALLTLLAACGPSSPDGETTNQGSPAGTEETVESKFDMAALTRGLGSSANQRFSRAKHDSITHVDPLSRVLAPRARGAHLPPSAEFALSSASLGTTE